MSEPLRLKTTDVISVTFQIKVGDISALEQALGEMPFKAANPIVRGIEQAYTKLHAEHVAKQEQDEKFEEISGGGQGSAPQVEESLNDQSEVYEDASES